MNGPKSLFVIALVCLALAVAAFTSTEPAPSVASPEPTVAGAHSGPPNVSVRVSGGALVELADDAQLCVRLVGVSPADGAEIVLGESVVALSGKPLPIEFRISYDPAAINPNGAYIVDATVVAGGVLVYWTATQPSVLTRGYPAAVKLDLVEAGPSSYAGLALTSGRLARTTY